MAKNVWRAALAFLVFTLPFSGARAQQPSDHSADMAAIKQVVARYSDALNRHDAHATAMTFSEDADFTDSGGLSFHGRKGIEDGFAALYAGNLRNTHRKDTVRSIRFLTPTIAAVDNDWEVTRLQSSDGSTLPPRKGIHAWIMTKRDGEWLITVFHGQTNMP